MCLAPDGFNGIRNEISPLVDGHAPKPTPFALLARLIRSFIANMQKSAIGNGWCPGIILGFVAAMLNGQAAAPDIGALLAEMTLAEKAGQLSMFSNGGATGPDNQPIDQMELAARGGIGAMLNLTGAEATNALQRQAVEESRLGIPILFALDVIHGYRTVYPIPLGLSSSWDPGLVERCARMAAVEASAEGVRWTFSPMIDMSRDARWGRIMEGSGEDPWLGSVMAAAWVRGYQGRDLSDPTALLATAKHFVGYGAVEGGREYDRADISRRTLHELHLPPFEAAVEAGVATVMSGFNTLGGMPVSANHYALTEILRDRWGFEGIVVSDWNSIGELIPHGVALDDREAAFKAFVAGVDMDMEADAYITQLPGLVESGLVAMERLDDAVSRVLRLKAELGLFDNPYTDPKRAGRVLLHPDHRQLAREAAEKSLVLLRNDPVGDAPLLPLKETGKVALIGRLAESGKDMLGAWVLRGRAEDVVTLKDAMEDRLGERMVYEPGVPMTGTSTDGLEAAVEAARSADLVVMALGEPERLSGEAHSRTRLGLPGRQLDMLKAVVATGQPVVLVLFSGRPLALPWEAQHVPAILHAWHPGVQAGPALVRTLFGDAAPSGKLTVSFPYSVGQMPLYYNTLNTGRPNPRDAGDRHVHGYIDSPHTALFPFGWGMTYTSFQYGATTVSHETITTNQLVAGELITAEATIRNTGARTGEEIVQLYIRQRGTSVARPVRELKGFERITLEPGEAQTVRFAIGAGELAFWNIEMEKAIEPGELTLWIAPHSRGGEPATVRIW